MEFKKGDKVRVYALKKNLEGKKINMWRVIRVAQRNPVKYLCLCDCGTEKIVMSQSLTSRRTKSCGCIIKKHNLSKTKAHRVWNDMMFRCYNQKCKAYKNYGGRGILVDKEWHDFRNFYKDMGNPERGMSLDRIDNDSNYSKKNCRWVTIADNLMNRRNTIFIEINGEKKTIIEWSKISGLSWDLLYRRFLNKNIPNDLILKPKDYFRGHNQHKKVICTEVIDE